MPLSKKGRKAKKRFTKQYGEERGEEVFHAYINKYPKRTEDWEER